MKRKAHPGFRTMTLGAVKLRMLREVAPLLTMVKVFVVEKPRATTSAPTEEEVVIPAKAVLGAL